MFRVDHSQSHGFGPSHYCTPQWGLLNSLLSNPKKDHMKKLHPYEVDVPTYNFKSHKRFGLHHAKGRFWVLFTIVFFDETFSMNSQETQTRIICKLYTLREFTSCNGLSNNPLKYCVPWKNLSNGLLSDPNKYHMQNLLHRKFDIPTYHFAVHKTIGI